MKKNFSFFSVILMVCLVMTSCSIGQNKVNQNVIKKGEVFIFNNEEKYDSALKKLAKLYNEKTGVKVKIETVADETYYDTLLSKANSADGPTAFFINGTKNIKTFSDYLMDISDTKFYEEIVSDDFVLQHNDKKCGVAIEAKGFGMLVNNQLLEKTGFESGYIKDFNTLKEVAEKITEKEKELGFSAFSGDNVSLDNEELYNRIWGNALRYEFRESGIKGIPETIAAKYFDNYLQFYDLLRNNCSKQTENDIKNDVENFKNAETAFYFTSEDIYESLLSMDYEKIGFLPIYLGIDDNNQGFNHCENNYLAVNSKSSDANRKVTMDFLCWVATTENSTIILANEMNVYAPFISAKPSKNFIGKDIIKSSVAGKKIISDAANNIPSEKWAENLKLLTEKYSNKKLRAEAMKKQLINSWQTLYKEEANK